MYEIIKYICISTISILMFQAIIVNILNKFAYQKEERFRQTRLITQLFYVISIAIFYMLLLENDEERYNIYNLLVIITIILLLVELAIRNKEFNKNAEKVQDNESIQLSKTASLFYEKNTNGIIEAKKGTQILKNVSLVLGITNFIYIVLIPVVLLFELVEMNNRSFLLLSVLTVFLTEAYLFFSQKEILLSDKEKKSKLLQTPKDWNKEIENKYGASIVGYSNHVSTTKAEISTTLDNLEMISRDIIDGENILVSNSSKSETKAIYYNAINKNFINKKSTLIIYEDIPSIKEAEAVINSLIEEYNNELIVRIISKQHISNTQIDKEANIYLATIQDILDSDIDYTKIQTIILNNTDKIIERSSNELYVLATTLKNLNHEYNYIMLSVATDALRIAIKNILFVEFFKEYQINRKRALQTLGVQVLKRNADNIKNHEKNNTSMNDLVKLAIETNKFAIDNVEIVSKKMPILDDAKKFDEVRGARNNSLTNRELNKLTNRIKINCNSLFQENANKKMFIKNDDERNLIYSIKAYSELNNGETYLGVVSSEYMFRDYIISEYLKKKGNFSDLDIILPQTMQNDLKILLGALLLQMLNLPVKEDVIIRRLQEYNNDIVLIEGYNRLSIITALNFLLESEFKIKTDITNYLLESVDKNGRKEYMLNSNFKFKLPKDLYAQSKMIIGGYEQEISSQKGYEIYQKYIPGQVHLIENNIYKIGNIENLNIIVSNVSADGLRKYKHDLNVKLYNIKSVEKEHDIRECSSATMKIQIPKCDIEIDTLGFYEFLDYTTLEEGEYVYRPLAEIQKDKVSRKYYNTRVMKLDITPSDIELAKFIQGENRDRLSCTFAFLMNELFETLLDENSSYVFAKAVVSNDSLIKNEEIKLYRPIVDNKLDKSSISIYIIEDLKISKGLLSTIENEIPRILSLIKKYLIWYSEADAERQKYIKRINKNNVLMLKELNEIIPTAFCE